MTHLSFLLLLYQMDDPQASSSALSQHSLVSNSHPPQQKEKKRVSLAVSPGEEEASALSPSLICLICANRPEPTRELFNEP